MPRRDWFSHIAYQGRVIFAALCLVIPVAGYAASGEVEQQHSAPSNPKAAQQDQPLANAPGASPLAQPSKAEPEAKAATYKPDCRAPKDHDEADLCLQWKSVQTAKRALHGANWQTVIGLFGLLGVLLTLIYTAKATKAAAKAAQAAEESVSVTKANAQLQLRAYVLVSAANIVRDSAVPFRIDLTIQNYGVTPAHNVRVAHRAVWWGIDDEGNWPEPVDAGTTTSLGANASLLARSVLKEKDIPVYDAAALEREFNAAIYAYGIVTYDDIFGSEQTTKFRHIVMGSSAGDRVVPCRDGNKAT